jgi:hypothetical protein
MPTKKQLKARRDTDETFGIRGAGASSQSYFGAPLNLDDFLFSVKREPAAYRAVFQVAHDIFAKWFKVVEVSEKPNENFDREVQKVLGALNAQEVYTHAAVFERLFGWSIVALTFVDYGKGIQKPAERPREILNLFPYSVLSVDVQGSDEEKNKDSERFGLPILYTLNREGAGQAKLHYTRTIHVATRLLDHRYKGLSVLESMYDDLTIFRNIRWGMGQTMFRIGGGVPDITGKNATKKDIDNLEASQQFKTLHARSHFLHSDKWTMEFKGAAGKALNPEPYVNSCMEQLSMASGIPAAIMRGAQAGALAGSDVNEREYFKFISDLQASYEPAIWQLIDLLMETGQIPTVEDYEIQWNGGFELNELDKAQVFLAKAQAIKLKTEFLKVNELRALEDPPLPALKGPEGDVIPGLQKPPAPQLPASPSGPPTAADSAKFPLIGKILLKFKGEKHEDSKSKQS